MNDTELGYEITAIAAGIDTFERAANAGKGVLGDEGLIPLYLGKELIKEKTYSSWTQVEEDVETVAAIVAKSGDGPRKMFLTKLVESLRVANILFQGGSVGYEEKLERLVGIPAERIENQFIKGLADRVDQLLERAGHTGGTFRDRVLAWEAGHRIEPDDLTRVFGEMMLEARDRTDRMVVPTDGYMMELNPVRNTHYTARCNFSEKKMDLNMDNTFSRSALKHLVAHECFPGHSTQNIYTVKSYKEGKSTADVLLCSLNGITGVIQEGIGDQGVELIDWIEDDNDAIHATLRRLRSAVATQGAWNLNVESADPDAVAAYMRDTGAMQEARISGRLGMARHPYRGPFIASYFYGNEAVRLVRTAVEGNPQKRDRFISELYGKMHSPESLCRANDVTYRSYGDV